MNNSKYLGKFSRTLYRLMLSVRRVGAKNVCEAFKKTDGSQCNTIQQIYVINLDRQEERWKRIESELQRLKDASGTRLTKLTERFSAIDARHLDESLSASTLCPEYSLEDHFFVEPNPQLMGDRAADYQHIRMTRQEIAVALSHIAVWKRIASSNSQYTLILEDDIYFRRDFADVMDRAWADRSLKLPDSFDMLYVSYEEAKTKAEKHWISDILFSPARGLWQLSGYVLSKQGAEKLLQLLPARGPVDLWLNHQFSHLNVLATYEPIVEQRRDLQSTNSYSILPVLERVGVLTQKEPSVFEPRELPTPVFAIGSKESGLSSLGMALSILGYRCYRHIDRLPQNEHENLFRRNETVFDAYVNVESLEHSDYVRIAKLYDRAKFIITIDDEDDAMTLEEDFFSLPDFFSQDERRTFLRSLKRLSADVLVLPKQHPDRWNPLCDFLGCKHPSLRYPIVENQSQSRLSVQNREAKQSALPPQIAMEHDSSPWIISASEDWSGLALDEVNEKASPEDSEHTTLDPARAPEESSWLLLEDTFPSNLALFSPDNYEPLDENLTRLALRQEKSAVREYTSASICSNQSYVHGRFSAVIKAAKGSGIVTGIFLHRNSPRQEIDVELLGRDTTKMITNVYYNPGAKGTRLEYGYRGTPVQIDLAFDASEKFHEYTIEWTSTSMRWFVDDQLVHERVNWNPTPIPHLPMQFYVNLWPSRSEELTGNLRDDELPHHTDVQLLDIKAHPSC